MALGDLLACEDTDLSSLSLENNPIDDAGIAFLSTALAANSTLKELNLSFASRVSQAGWREFSACLRSPVSVLKGLDLSSTIIADEGAAALGRTLDMYDSSDDGAPLITSAG